MALFQQFRVHLTVVIHAPSAAMQVIAGRKTQGAIEGEILVNGHPKVQATWARSIGYVEQTGKLYKHLAGACAGSLCCVPLCLTCYGGHAII
jgi:hypothetical protein